MGNPFKTRQDAAAPLSLFEIYSGYVLTQGRDALESVILWEKILRFSAIVLAAAVLSLWYTSETLLSPDVLMIKAVLSAIVMGLCGFLLWQARGRTQHEVRVDLINGELSQVLRQGGGTERKLLCVKFIEVESLFIKRNRDLPQGSALYMRLKGESEPVLLATGLLAALEEVHQRMSADLHKAHRMYSRAARDTARAVAKYKGLQTA